ncbi:hypothetical protein E1286_12870 [Nonomuraea terrae]|uniref:ATP-binding protein n=1 Tax=Nonomuraea terrae TaxID=2530383 RepID=A0A4R4YX80_9ACTN|nr:caspase family protein [Nonomuraea terrae]TDD50023.1 hypothetical protein E1286_12870 [Nonomuraea terrae]
MTVRHALLIGVPRCDDRELDDLGDVVRTDVRAMRQSLDQSGYAVVESFGVEESEEPTGTRIRRRIRRACEEVPEGGVLLLYFSGHGVSLDGSDYLVPCDADRGTGALAVDELVSFVPDGLEGCRARLVVFFVDACRNAPAGEHNPVVHGGRLPYWKGGDFVMITGCGPGQKCHYGETGSYFTQALAQTLDRRNPARTLQQVFDDVRRQMARVARPTDEQPQQPHAHHVLSERMPGADLAICDGDDLTVAWRRAVETTPLWDLSAEAVPTATREKVREVVERCAVRRNEAAAELRRHVRIDDPWSDQNYPIRILDRLVELLDGAELTPAETALLVAAPFLRECLIGAGIRQAARIKPISFARTYEPGPRNDLELTHEMHQHLLQRAEGLAAREAYAARDALAMWLVHQWLAVGSALWRGEDAKQLYAATASALDVTPKAPRGERAGLVEALVLAVGSDLADHDLAERAYLDGRWRVLTRVLGVAGTLAVDVRRLPSVIADHLGTHLELPLSTVTSAVERLEWRHSEEALNLCLSCEHPALHLALEDVVRRADAALAAAQADKHLAPVLVKRLPERVTADELRPEQRERTPAYATPVMRFRLAEEKVRELLMGRQLYDDPSLAIRELYQNALDACRYRDTRLRYIRREGWHGEITFRQGVKDGRPYIECQDNGVGMDADTLLHVFANAGERFVYRQQYRAEQAEWESADPPLRMVSNSQFGVGVFSYFMLADEIEVLTRPVNRHGVPAQQAHSVHIASSGSLLQITPSEAGMPEGGTRVRLYLSGDEKVSVLRTMRRLLWVSDYDVEVTEEDRGSERWTAGKLRYQDDSPLKVGADLWWVSGNGGLLADGILTTEQMFGVVVNLRGVHRPRFTVDRKKLREWDRTWVHEETERSLPALETWPGLTMSWLWEMTEDTPQRAQRVFDHLVKIDAQVPIGEFWARDLLVPIRAVGCLPEDAALLSLRSQEGRYAVWLRTWRALQWHALLGHIPRSRMIQAAGGGSGEGCPLVGPVDAKLLEGLAHGTRASREHLLEGLADSEESVVSVLRRLRRYAITGLDVSVARAIPPVTRALTDEERPLFAVLTAWLCVGAARDEDSFGHLILASRRLDLPLGEVLRRAAELAPPGWSIPELDLGPLADHVCTEMDARLMSRDWDGMRPWLTGDIAPSRVADTSVERGLSVKDVLDMYGRFAPLGVRVQGSERYPDDLNPLELEALRLVDHVGQRITRMHLVVVAGRAGLSVHEAHAALARLEVRGLLERPEIAGSPDLRPGRDEVHFVLTCLSMSGAAEKPDVADRMTALRIAATVERESLRHPVETRIREAAVLATPGEPFTKVDLIRAAVELRCAIGVAREKLLSFYPGADAEAVSPEEAPLVLGRYVAGMLREAETSAALSWDLDPGKLIQNAYFSGMSVGAFLRRLRTYRALGMPVPDVHDEALDEFHPTEEDAKLLSRTGAGEPYMSEVDPLSLVQVAGRNGWTVAGTHRRLLRFTPLGVTLDYPHDACPDTIVHWQDLLALTVHLDGHAPAIAGAVTPAHLVRAAEELDETPERVRERLLRYAQLFGLTVPEEIIVA